MMEKKKKISEMRNLGPKVEADLNAAGIYGAIHNLDWRERFHQPKKNNLRLSQRNCESQDGFCSLAVMLGL